MYMFQQTDTPNYSSTIGARVLYLVGLGLKYIVINSAIGVLC